MHYVAQKLSRTRYAPLAPSSNPFPGPLTNNSRGEARTVYADRGCVFYNIRISDSCLECPLSVCKYDDPAKALEFIKRARELARAGV